MLLGFREWEGVLRRRDLDVCMLVEMASSGYVCFRGRIVKFEGFCFVLVLVFFRLLFF